MNVHLFYRTEDWLSAFCRRVADPQPESGTRSVLSQRELILVPQLGFASYLETALATRFGVAAGIEFDLPSRFLWSLTAASFADVAGQAPFQAERLRWTIYSILFNQHDLPLGLAERVAALRGNEGAPGAEQNRLGLFELACRLARVFERYVVSRVDWLKSWETGVSALSAPSQGRPAATPLGMRKVANFQSFEPWQAWLWREILARQEQLAQEHPLQKFERQIEVVARTAKAQGFYRMTLMGMPKLTLDQMRLFARLGKHIDIAWLAMNPCQSYWSDLPELARKEPEAFLPDTPWLNELGPALLGLWGKAQRDYLTLLQELEETQSLGVQIHQHEVQLAPAKTSLMRLQAAILLREAFVPDTPVSDHAASKTTASKSHIQVHACLGLTHQLRVLRERLAGLFNGTLETKFSPNQCLVLCADLEAARPAIHQVFGETGIAYRIARSPNETSGLASLVLSFLSFMPNQFSLTQLRTWLNQVEFLALARLDANDAQRWIGALSDAGFVSNASSKHSFDVAYERLLLGSVMDAGSGAQVLGRWTVPALSLVQLQGFEHALSLLESLKRLVTGLASMREWVATLDTWLITWVESARGVQLDASTNRGTTQTDSIPEQLLGLRGALNQLNASSSDPIDADIFRACLVEGLEMRSASGQHVGSLHFLPLDTQLIPATQVVAVLGLDEGAWPRAQPQDELDLTRAWSRRGDASLYYQDRAQLLEALLAARAHFWLFYQGFDAVTGDAFGASSQVSELLTQLDTQPQHHRVTVPQASKRAQFLGEANSTQLVKRAAEHFAESAAQASVLNLRHLVDTVLDSSKSLLRVWDVSFTEESGLSEQEPLDAAVLDDGDRNLQGTLSVSLAEQILRAELPSALLGSKEPALQTALALYIQDHPSLAAAPVALVMARAIVDRSLKLVEGVAGTAGLDRSPDRSSSLWRKQSLALEFDAWSVQTELALWNEAQQCSMVFARSSVSPYFLVYGYLQHCLSNAMLGPSTCLVQPFKGKAKRFMPFATSKLAMAALGQWLKVFESLIKQPQDFRAKEWISETVLSNAAPEEREPSGQAAQSSVSALLWKDAYFDARDMQTSLANLIESLRAALFVEPKKTKSPAPAEAQTGDE